MGEVGAARAAWDQLALDEGDAGAAAAGAAVEPLSLPDEAAGVAVLLDSVLVLADELVEVELFPPRLSVL